MNAKLAARAVASALALPLCSIAVSAPQQISAALAVACLMAIWEPGGIVPTIVPNTLTIKQQGGKIVGTLESSTGYWRFTGLVDGSRIRFTISPTGPYGAYVLEEFTGVIAPDAMRGSVVTVVHSPRGPLPKGLDRLASGPPGAGAFDLDRLPP